ncbi:MAG: DUF2075 domain-containing protein, partial [Chitinophagaceae bacterium]|nr:DUF2075 domain-containing protein [Oligoflexus sp.]
MGSCYYSNSIKNFIDDSEDSIFGKLSIAHAHELDELQKAAWLAQIRILKEQLIQIETGHIFFELSIPRMGKRVDNVLIIGDTIFVLEFKVGAETHEKHGKDQVIDYSLDLKNFHENSHSCKIVPILVSTEASSKDNKFAQYEDQIHHPLLINKSAIGQTLLLFTCSETESIDPYAWIQSRYKPTPTIIEAARVLYQGHSVANITRNDADAINLSLTTRCIDAIINTAKLSGHKTICFVTGVPGAGKTLAGLNIAIQRKNTHQDEHAIFLSGNGPLVDVLREALSQDEARRSKNTSEKVSKKESLRKTRSFIQNIHHFRDEYFEDKTPPVEKVVIFDEAQRAWNRAKTSEFMKAKKGIQNFGMSESEFLISVMDRHEGACTIICLIGGGQEINTGEAGLEEWFKSLKERFPHWKIFYSDLIVHDNNYVKDPALISWMESHAKAEPNLHLGVSLRSFRAEKLSAFVKSALDLKKAEAKQIYTENLRSKYPIVL